jgi:hypothetical protein
MKENKFKLIRTAILSQKIKKIDLAQECSFYHNENYLKLLELFQLLLKNKFKNFDKLKFHTYVSANSEKIYSVRIWSTVFFKNNFKTVFELEYKGNDNVFLLKDLFQSNFELLKTEDNSLLNEYNTTILNIKNLFEKEILSFINKEKYTYKQYFFYIEKKEKLYKELKVFFDNVLQEEKNNQFLKESLEKYFDFSKIGFNIKTLLSNDNEFKHTFKKGIEYKVLIHLRNVTEIEKITSNLSFDKYSYFGEFEYNISLGILKWKPNMFKNEKYLKNKIPVQKFLKTTFPKKVLSLFGLEYK